MIQTLSRAAKGAAVGGRSDGSPARRRAVVVRWAALAACVVALMVASFAAGAGYARSVARPAGGATGQVAPAATDGDVPAAANSATQPPANLGRQFDSFWEAWNFVEKEHYRQPVDRTKLVQGAIRGMLGALGDQHSAYLDPASTRVDKASLDGVIEGIGASIEIRERRHTVVTAIDDGPAARAGLRTGDVVVKVDGRDVGSLSLAEAVALIRGPAGTKVKLTVSRPDDPDAPPLEMELTRSRIELESVSSKMVADGIGYVRVRVFGTQTLPQLQRALREMRARRVRGVVLDLRDNPGGYLSSAVDVASQFLKEGSVVVYEERETRRTPVLARGGGLATDLTIAVLVNRGSASASEIVAGALRDHNRAVLVGEPTFGKGSVQKPHDLSDGSSIRVTVGDWLTPGGKQIQNNGLAPSIEAKATADDEKGKRDVALEKALEWFKAAPLPSPGPVD